jgi:cytochrome bd-type quinol oxidase subunit 2
MESVNILVFTTLIGFFIIVIGTILLLAKIDKDSISLEARKIRFGAAILSGILLLFLVVIVMYFSAPSSEAAAAIFDRTITALSPIVGVLVAYFFAPKSNDQ